MSNDPGQFGQSSNPYQAPRSTVADVTPQVTVGELIPGGKSVPAGNALQWFGGAWALFKESPGIWIANIIILFLLTMVIGIVPFIGNIATALLTPVFIAGLLIGCRALDAGDQLEIGHLFAGFKGKAGPLLLVGLLLLIGMIVVIAIAGIVAGVFGGAFFSLFVGATPDPAAFNGTGFAVALLLVFALMIPLMAAYLYAPALVVFHDLGAIEAMKQSLMGCLRNILAHLLFGALMIVALIVAMIPLGLGLLVVLPIIYASLYTAYKDIYLRG